MVPRFTAVILAVSAGLGIVNLRFGVASEGPHPAATGPRLGEECPPEGEAEFIKELVKLQQAVMQQDPTLQGRRGQHPKQHGCVLADFVVCEGVPEDLRCGIFSEPRTYRAIIRFSNGGSFDDTKPDVRGMAVKLVGVPGRQALGEGKNGETQDFILIDHPMFFAKNVENMLTLFKAIVAGKKGNAELLKQFAAKHPEEFRIFAETQGKQLPSSPLQIQYWSTVPYRLGTGAVKYTARPREQAAEDQHTAGKSKDYLRAAMVKRLSAAEEPVVFDFCVQRQSDPAEQLIEDPTREWTTPEEPLATIVIRPHRFDTEEQQQFGENLVFDPWHALEEHRPLGGINRARREVYQMSSALRHKVRQEQGKEPSGGDEPTAEDLDQFQRAVPR